MNFTSSEEINPAQNWMTGSKLSKRFSRLGNKPGTNGGRRLRGYSVLWFQLKPDIKNIPPLANEALEVGSVTFYRDIHNLGGNILQWTPEFDTRHIIPAGCAGAIPLPPRRHAPAPRLLIPQTQHQRSGARSADRTS